MKQRGLMIAFLLILTTLFVNATEFQRTGWNLISVCQEMNTSDLDMTGIEQIQSQDGDFLFTGEDARFSDLEVLHAGYGYWIKGSIGTNFDSGESGGSLTSPLGRTGWNLMAMCENIAMEDLDMSGIEQIQDQNGSVIFTGIDLEATDLLQLLNGYGYWVKGTAGTIFNSKSTPYIPNNFDYEAINNLGEFVELDQYGYSIKIYSDYNVTADDTAKHASIVVSMNGVELPLMSVQDTYRGHELVIAVYNSSGELVGVSERTSVVTTDSVTYIDFNFEDSSVNHTPTLELSNDHPIIGEGNIDKVVVEVLAQDIDRDPLTIGLIGNPSFVTIIDNNITIQVEGQPISEYIMQVYAEDIHGLRAEKNLTISIVDVERPTIDLRGMKEVILAPNLTQSISIETRDIDTISLAEGTPSFISLMGVPDPMNHDMSNFTVEINPLADTPTGYYKITLIGTNNLTEDVNETINLFYGVEAPSVYFPELTEPTPAIPQNVILNQGDLLSLDFELKNADSLVVGNMLTPDIIDPTRMITVSNFANISGDKLNLTPPTDLDVIWYRLELILTDSETGAETVKYLDIQINPIGTNHAPTIRLSQYYITVDEGNTEKIIVEVNATDIEDGNATLSLMASPPFVTFEDNNITIQLTGTEPIGYYTVDFEAQDSEGIMSNRALLIEVVKIERPVIQTIPTSEVVLAEGMSISVNIESRDIDSVHLAEGTPSFITLMPPPSPMDHDMSSFTIDINPMIDPDTNVPLGYYPITIIGTNNILGTDVNETVNLFYGTTPPSVYFPELGSPPTAIGQRVILNQGDILNLDFMLTNADGIRLGEMLTMDMITPPYTNMIPVPTFATINGDSIILTPSIELNATSYTLDLILTDSITGAETINLLDIEIRPYGTNHAPRIELSEYNVTIEEGTTQKIIVEVNATDVEDGNATLSLMDSPPFVTLVDNNITINPTGQLPGDYHVGIEAMDNDGEIAYRELGIKILDVEQPSIQIMPPEVVIIKDMMGSVIVETRDIDSLYLAEGTPDFISIDAPAGTHNFTVQNVNINPVAETPTGYYKIVLVGTNDILGTDVNETIHLFYGIEPPSVYFPDLMDSAPPAPQWVGLNQGDNLNIDFVLNNADGIRLGNMMYMDPSDPADPTRMVTVPSFATINGNRLELSTPIDLDIRAYILELILTDSTTGVETVNFLDIAVSPLGTNHAPTIKLSQNYIAVNEGSSQKISIEVNATDIEDGNATLSLIASPPFVTLIDNNITVQFTGTEAIDTYNVGIEARDNDGLISYQNLTIEILKIERPKIDIMEREVVVDSSISNHTVPFYTRDIDSIRLSAGTPTFITLMSDPASTHEMSTYSLEMNLTDVEFGYYQVDIIGTNDIIDEDVNETIHFFYGVIPPSVYFPDAVILAPEVQYVTLNQGDTLDLDFVLTNADGMILGDMLTMDMETPPYTDMMTIPSFATISGESVILTPPMDLNTTFYTLELMVTDSTTGAKTVKTLEIEVKPYGTNHAPTLSFSENNITIGEGSTELIKVEINTSDIDGDTLTLTEMVMPPFVTHVDNNLTIDPSGQPVGDYLVTFRVEDEHGIGTERDLIIKIIDVERPELHATVMPEVVLADGETYTLPIEARDIDSVRLATGTASFVTLAEGEAPTHEISNYDLQINPVADTPNGYYKIVVIGTNDIIGQEVNETINLFYGIDRPSLYFPELETPATPEMPQMAILNQGEALDLEFVLTNATSVAVKEIKYMDPNDATNMIIAPNFVTVIGEDRIEIASPADLEPRVYYLELLTIDSATGAETINYLDIQVNPVGTNRAPIVELSEDNVTIIEGSTETVMVEVNVTDIDGDNVTITLIDPPAFITLTADNNISIDPTGQPMGIYHVTVEARDTDGLSDTKELGIEITPNESSEVRELPLIIVRIEFDDYQFENGVSTWGSKIFGNEEGQLNHYYNEISYGKFQFKEANETDETENDGIITVHLAEDHPGNVDAFIDRINSAATLADEFIDFSKYDTNENGAISRDELQIMFLVAGGESATSVTPGVWAHAWCMYGENADAPTLDSVKIMNCADNGGYSRFGEKHFALDGTDASMGIIAHELGHAALELPDLYDYDKSSNGIGDFGLMGGGSWGYKPGDNRPGDTPVHMTGWSKIRSGFAYATVLDENVTNLNIRGSIYDDYQVYRVETGVVNEYFLIENRVAGGYDMGLTSLAGTDSFTGGLSILHIDDTQEYNTDDAHRIVDIEEANDAGLDDKSHSGHINNLFFSGNSDSFTPTTTPNSNNNDGDSTGISVTNISDSGDTMSADIEIN